MIEDGKVTPNQNLTMAVNQVRNLKTVHTYKVCILVALAT